MALLSNDQGALSGYKVGRALLSAVLEIATCITAFVFVSGSFLPFNNSPVPLSSRLLCGALCAESGLLSRKIMHDLRKEMPRHLPKSPGDSTHRTKKVFKAAVLTDIHVGKLERKYNGTVRAYSHLVERHLPGVLEAIQKQHAPDLIVNLGDLIRGSTHDVDLRTYRGLMSYFKQLISPVLHLIGNHELKAMQLAEVETIWQECGFDQKSYGAKDIQGFHVVWLGLRSQMHEGVKRHYLPDEQLVWLKEHFQHNTQPTILFTHCPIDDHDLDGEFYYEGCNKSNIAFFLENQAAVREVISQSGSVIAVVQGHLHHFTAKQIDGISYITCPSMADNICAPGVEDNVPDIYTLLTLDSDTGKLITAKAFSGKYAFAGYEIA